MRYAKISGKVGNAPGFTIVELLIVVVVIAILASITIVSYNGVTKQARAAVMKSDLRSAADIILMDAVSGTLPATLSEANGGSGLTASAGAEFRYRPAGVGSSSDFCLAVVGNDASFQAINGGTVEDGSCYNVALGATAPSALLVDGVTTTNPYYSVSTGLQSVTVDLGSARDISTIRVWHYYSDGRTYYQTRTQVSADNTNWTTVFDSATSGTYPEPTNGSGKTITFPMRKARYIRDYLNGSTSNTGNHWVEIQAY